MIVVAGLERSSDARGRGEEDQLICKIAWQEWVEEWHLGIGVVIRAQGGGFGCGVDERERARGASAGQRAVGGGVGCGEWQAVKPAGKNGRKGARMWSKMDTG